MKKTMSREVDLGNEPVRHLLLVLAVPAITSQVVNALYNMVDRMYIGHIPEVGSAALTGVGVCFPIIMIISAFAYLMGMGGAPRASIYMGKKDNDTAEKILGNSFSALVIVSIILTVTVLVFQEPLLYLFGASENTISYAKSYMTIYAIGTIFVQLTLGMNLVCCLCHNHLAHCRVCAVDICIYIHKRSAVGRIVTMGASHLSGMYLPYGRSGFLPANIYRIRKF